MAPKYRHAIVRKLCKLLSIKDQAENSTKFLIYSKIFKDPLKFLTDNEFTPIKSKRKKKLTYKDPSEQINPFKTQQLSVQCLKIQTTSLSQFIIKFKCF